MLLSNTSLLGTSVRGQTCISEVKERCSTILGFEFLYIMCFAFPTKQKKISKNCLLNPRFLQNTFYLLQVSILHSITGSSKKSQIILYSPKQSFKELFCYFIRNLFCLENCTTKLPFSLLEKGGKNIPFLFPHQHSELTW